MPSFKKNILIVTAYPVNNLTAGQGNVNILTDDLIAKGYDISLVCFSYPHHTIERKERFKEILFINQKRPQRFLYMLLLGFFFPLYTARFSFRALKFITDRVSSSNLIFLDYSQVYIYSLFIKQKDKICMFMHDVIYQKYHREWQHIWYGIPVLNYIKLTEKFMFNHCKKISIASFKDLDIVRKEYNVNAIPAILKKRFTIAASLNIPVNLSHFVFLGAWNRKENLDGLKWFFNEVYPLLNNTFSCTVLGHGMPEDVKVKLPSSVNLPGFVDDMRVYLQGASALISPLFSGAGIKFKVLDATANGCRVIGTDVSYEGIDVSAKNLLLIANNAKEFAKNVDYCIANAYNPDEIKNVLGQYINRFIDTTEWIENCMVD